MKTLQKKTANRNPKSSVFVTQLSDSNVSLNFKGKPTDDFYSYGDAYHRAAMALFEAHFSSGTRHDLDVLPIAYLLRHAAELFLKAVVRYGNIMLSLNDEPAVPVRQTHRLTLLLDDVRPIFRVMGWTWDAETDGFRSFDDFRKFVSDLESDDVLGTDDSQADMWRYPVKRKDDAAHLPVRFNFDVGEFVRRVDQLLRMLDGAATGLDMTVDSTLEALGDAAEYPPDYEPGDYEPMEFEPDDYHEPPDYDPEEYEDNYDPGDYEPPDNE